MTTSSGSVSADTSLQAGLLLIDPTPTGEGKTFSRALFEYLAKWGIPAREFALVLSAQTPPARLPELDLSAFVDPEGRLDCAALAPIVVEHADHADLSIFRVRLHDGDRENALSLIRDFAGYFRCPVMTMVSEGADPIGHEPYLSDDDVVGTIDVREEYSDGSLFPEIIRKIGPKKPSRTMMPATAPIDHRSKPPLPGRSASRKARVLMVQGTTSNAGKTFLVTALARYFANRGLAVAPFKGQNMSNNARIVDGGEIGVAQYIQALAARARPDVRMNPVLLKPQSSGSQVILMGRPDYAQTHLPWRMRKPLCWPSVIGAIEDLRGDYDLIIAEGAGSAMEPYLRDNDIVNMRVALETDASVLVTTDTARGGAFAHLYGLWTMMNDREKARIKGFILNLFYPTGNAEMLIPAMDELQRLTGGTPVLGVIPEIAHCLPEEDRFSLRAAAADKAHVVAIVAYPMMSNFDEFSALQSLEGVSVRWAHAASQLAGADLVILPGSKHVAADLEWMRSQGMDEAIRSAARKGGRILGICGGLQMLGHRIDDPEEIEGAAQGLGLLDIQTRFQRDKIQQSMNDRFYSIEGEWKNISTTIIAGYEIRNGFSRIVDGGGAREVLSDGRGFVQRNILGLYLHGLFENRGIVEAMFGESADFQSDLDISFEKMANTLSQYLDMDLIERMVTG